MPNNKDHFCLVSDTSFTATGVALYQHQKGEWKLVGFNSKRLPGSARNYSISKLELFGLAINIASFKHLLRHAYFTVVIDHSALVYILQSKKEPPTLRLKKLIEILGGYSFKVQLMKGKDMHVSDFLSRHPGEDGSPQNEIILISFEIMEIEQNQTRLHKIHEMLKNEEALDSMLEIISPDQLMITTRSRGKAPPIYPLRGDHKLLEHTGIIPQQEDDQDQDLNPERDQIYPEENPEVEAPREKPRLIPKPRLSKKRPIPAPCLKNKVKEQPCQQINPTPMPDIPTHEDKVKDTNTELEVKHLDIRLVGNLQNPELETEVETTVRPPDPYFYREKECMFDHINDEDIIRKHIPKQIELDKWIEKIKRKVIHDYDVPITVKEMAAEYSTSPKYRDIYNYLNKGFISSQYKGTSL